jgi:hypothetical protein
MDIAEEAPPWRKKKKEPVGSNLYEVLERDMAMGSKEINDKDETFLMSTSLTQLSSSSRRSTPLIELNGSINGHPCKILIDCGASCDFVSDRIVKKYQLKKETFSPGLTIGLPDGSRSQSNEEVRGHRVVLPGFNGKVNLIVTRYNQHDIILGLPWFKKHQPLIDWKKDKILKVEDEDEFTDTDTSPTLMGHSRDGKEAVPVVSTRQMGGGKEQQIVKSGQWKAGKIKWIESDAEANHIIGRISAIEVVYANGRNGRMLVSQNDGVNDLDVSASTEQRLCSMNVVTTSGTGDEQLAFLCMNTQQEDKDEERPEPKALICPGWLQPVLEQYKDVLNADGHMSLPPSREEDHRIELVPGAKPIKCRSYPLSPKHQDTLKRTLDDLLKRGHISPSKSPWAAPVHFVPKKDGSFRMVVDYRRLNEVTVKNSAPIPLAQDLFNRLRGSVVYTKLDLKSGYNQLLVHASDREKTAFNSYFGHHEFNVMPFGLTNAPATFVTLMTRVLKEYINQFVICFVDDILIYSKSMDEHVIHVAKVLETLQRNQLYVNPDKCEWGVDKVSFLGHVVSAKGIAVDGSKIEAIQGWPVPKNVAELRSFLGLAGYYRAYVPHYSQVAADLTCLTGKSQSWVWGESQERAFRRLKELLSSAPVLVVPDMDQPFVIHTDASDFAVGAMLEQNQGGGLQPIAYLSKKLNPAQCNYSTYEKELLAIVEALKEWKHYLLGSKHRIRIVCDHQPLKSLLNQQVLSARVARWIDFIQLFYLRIEHKPGQQNAAADGLSRRADHDDGASVRAEQRTANIKSLLSTVYSNELVVQEIVEQIKAAYHRDPECVKIMEDPSRYRYVVIDGLLMRHDRCIYVPNDRELKARLLREAHDCPMGGHLGNYKTLMKISRYYYWPGLRKEVQLYVQSCVACSQNKHTNQSPIGLLHPIPIPENRWEVWSIDLVGPLPKTSRGHDTIVVMVDKFTKLAHFAPTVISVTACQLAEIVLTRIVLHHGIPKAFISDRDPRFTGHMWKALWKLLGTDLNMSTAYHPESDGQTERMNRTLEEMLRAYVNDKGTDWDQHLITAELAYNTAVHDSTGYSPFRLSYGTDPRLAMDHALVQCKLSDNPTAVELVQRWNADLEQARYSLQQAQQRQARQANQHRREHEYKVGDQVMLTTQNMRMRSGKLNARFIGPYTIKKVLSDVNVELELPSTMRIYPVFHVSKLKPYQPSDAELFPNRSQLGRPAPVVEEDGSEYYKIEYIMAKRRKKVGNRYVTQYLVKWLGYDVDEASWVSIKDFTADAHTFIDEFERRTCEENIE